MKILLGSNSPRRKELLEQLQYDFQMVSISCEEIYPEGLAIGNIAGYLSELKANSYPDLEQNEVLLTADTIVALDQKVLGKPKNHREALEMLLKLSGKSHEVYTGLTLRTHDKMITATDVATVYFDKITQLEAEYYIEQSQPFDKAGSYGVQDWIGMAKINKIEGSYYTVMGLPTHLLYRSLQELQ